MIVAVLAPGPSRDLRVVEPVRQESHDGPALGQVAQLAERAQVAQEGGRLVAVLEGEERVQERVGVRAAPVVGAGLHGSEASSHGGVAY